MNIEREKDLSKEFFASKSIYDITKFTTLDFKDHLSCILWFAKCNMKCVYCYNCEIVNGSGKLTNIEVLDFLKSRVKKLDAVVLSGGECTLSPDIIKICKEIRKLGFKIKIDTNGINFSILKELIDLCLVDFIALDYKAPIKKFKDITKSKTIDKFYKTLDMLISKKFPFEARTTVHSNLLNEDDINEIILDLYKREYTNTYYIQNYLHVEETLGGVKLPTKSINKKQISDLLVVEYRN